MSIIEIDPLCANDIANDPDISSAEQWEDYDGLTRQEGVAYSTGDVPFTAGQMLLIKQVISNPDQEAGLYKHVDLYEARPTQAGDVGPFAFALQSSTVNEQQAAVLMQGHMQGDWSGTDQGEVWAAGDVLYVAADGLLTTDSSISLNIAVGQIITPEVAMIFAGAAHPISESAIIDLDRMRWRGNWVNGQTYMVSDVTLDYPWLMIANKETTDRPAPQAVGDPAWYYGGASPVSDILAKTLLVQNSYVLTEAMFLTGYRMYLTAGNQYSLFLRNDDTGQIDQLWSSTASQTGWVNTATSGRVFAAGTSFTLGLYATEPDPSPVAYVLSYNYTTPNNENAPGVGVMSQANRLTDSLRVNKTDQTGDQWQGGAGPLAQMTPGDTITGAGMTWAIQTITEEIDYIDFTVAPSQQGTTGVQNFTFETVTATPISTIIDPDFYAGDANVQPAYRVDGGAVQQTDNAYGIDIEWQRASVSDDWDFMASTEATGGSSEGGGGASTFLQLTDTPSAYTGERSGLEVGPSSSLILHQAGHVRRDGDTMSGDLNMGGNRVDYTSGIGLNVDTTVGALDETGYTAFGSEFGPALILYGTDNPINPYVMRLRPTKDKWRMQIDLSSRITFRDDASIPNASIDPVGTAITDILTVLTAEKGDARYLSLSGGTMTGPLNMGGQTIVSSGTITLNGNTNVRTTDSTGYLVVGNSNGANTVFYGSSHASLADTFQLRNTNNTWRLRMDATNDFTFRGADAATSAIIEGRGTTMADVTSVVTQQKGDARYTTVAAQSAMLSAVARMASDLGLTDTVKALEGFDMDHITFQNGSRAGTSEQWEYDRQQNIIDSIDAGITTQKAGDTTLDKRRAEAVAIQNYLVETSLESDSANNAVDAADAAWVESNPRPNEGEKT